MQIIRNRRDFLASASLAAAAAGGFFGPGHALADEGRPEVTTIRLRFEDAPPSWINGVADNGTCVAPLYITEELLRAEGFTEIRYVSVKNGPPYAQAFTRGEIDFTLRFAPGAVRWLDAGVPITVLAGVHPGCFGLFAHEPVRTFTDLKGKQVGIEDVPESAQHLFASIMAAHVGLDPQIDINWVTTEDVANPMELFVQGKIDALLAFVSEFPELRARKTGRMLVDMAMDAPWSQYFCCMVVGHRDFVGQYPVATKRALRAILKATDLCATNPAQAARQMVEGGFAQHYDIQLELLTELPYNLWRELDPEDSLRFYALWLHEFGEIDSTPNQLIAAGTDWRFVNELKRELKA
jgi:NitT/TauT family transport system substrate-binding protein